MRIHSRVLRRSAKCREHHGPARCGSLCSRWYWAFAFLGSRGIWDPDEGRYTNVALNMLDSGDWLTTDYVLASL